jgi:hypothetical protein
MRRFISTVFLSLFLVGCGGFVEKQSEIADEAAYAIPSAIKNGRIDEADSISQSFQTLYSTPKNPIVIKPIIDPITGLPDVILPAYLKGKVVVVNSADYQDLLKTKSVANQLTKDNKDLLNYKTEAEKQKIADDQILNALLKEMNAYKASNFYKAYIFYHTSLWLIPASILIIIVVCLIFPPLVGPIMTILGTLAGMIFNFFSFFLKKL